MISDYETGLVIFSIAVSIMASYVAASTGNKVRYRLTGAVLAAGAGAWAVYFIAMLVFQLPIPMSYDIPVTLLSLLIVVLVSGFALRATNTVLEKRTTELSQANVLLQQEIQERTKSEERIRLLSRIHAVMSGINSLIVRVRDRQELFNEACRIAVEHGRFKLAWIGMVDMQRLEVRPLAWVGHNDGFLSEIRLSVRPDLPEQFGVAGRAVHDKKPVVVNDIANDSRMLYAKESLQRGFRAIVGLPLLVEGEAIGAFVLYAANAGVFDKEEMKLLTELAGDISFALELIDKRDKLNYLAYYDALTGLPNRALFNDRMTQVLRAASHEETKTALVLIDLERFRVINDTLGRSAADELLKLVAQRLQSVIFDRDSVARDHADVFAAMFPGIRDEADIAHLVEEKIIGCLNQSFTIAGQELRISMKAGVALFPGDALVPEALFSCAEAALRQAKGSRDHYLFYAPRMNAFVAERLKLESKLQQALEREQFVLFYQPKVDLSTGRVVGLEADALERPRHGAGAAHAVHPFARGNGNDRRGGRVGNETSGIAIRGVAGGRFAAVADRGQRVGGAVEAQGFCRLGTAGHRDRGQTRAWSGYRNHRKHDHGGH
ncbi:MAG: diguanylate cyclase [Betaproteobacteria bacterium]|nr:diguanylate cyclase [Betaproteobacteria bacterium]